MTTPTPHGRTWALGPVWLVLAAIVSVQVGAAFAKSLFESAAPAVIAWLRLASAAVILLVVTRPRLRGRSRADWWWVLGYSTALVSMNLAIYESFSRIPIGLAVTVEFLGPLAVALLSSRHLRDLAWVALAAIGVTLLGTAPDRVDPLGLALAILAGVAWAAYILLSQQTGRRWEGITGVTVANTFGALLLTGPALLAGAATSLDTRILGIGLLVGLLSSVIPYSLELNALRHLPAGVFSILMSLEPAVAALAALIVLGEQLRPIELVAMACVIVASVGATRGRRRQAGEDLEASSQLQ